MKINTLRYAILIVAASAGMIEADAQSVRDINVKNVKFETRDSNSDAEDELQSTDEINEVDDAQWWRNFGDPILDSLVNLAIERNYDLVIAAKRVDAAANAVGSAKAAYYPHVNVNAGWNANRDSGAMQGHGVSASKIQYWNGGATMNWEIDLFGKIRASVKQSNSQLRVSRAEYAASMVSIQAQVATAYVNLRVYQAEMEVALTHSENQLQVVKITEARHKAGLASMLDVAQAKTVYFSTKASIPLLETSIRTTLNQLALLLGERQADLLQVMEDSKSLLNHSQLVAKNISLDLINRRPDIVAARQQIQVAADAVGIAKKDYLPTLSLTGTIGTSAHEMGDLFARNSYSYTVAPTLSWTLFDGFARKRATTDAKIQMESAIASYNQAVLQAVGEADNALAAYTNDLEYMKTLEEVVDQSEQAYDKSLDLYKRGLSAFSNVVDAQLNLLEYQNSLIVAKGDALVSLINLYKAVGGGWNNDID